MNKFSFLKLKKIIFSLFVGLLVFKSQVAVSKNTAPLLWSSAPDRAICPDSESYVWVAHTEGFDCVRYFSGDDLHNASIVIVAFSGDRDNLLKLPPEDIRNNTRQSRQAIAAKLSAQVGVPLVLVARPGTYGSSGDHRQRRQAREFLALDAALTKIRQRYAIDKFVLLGHSGGATAAAAMLTLGRADIRCVVLTSGAFDLLERSRRRAVAEGRTVIPDLDTTGLATPFDPLYKIAAIIPDPSRKIMMLGNAKDKVTPYDLQIKFANALASAGHNVELHDVPARAPGFHDLLDEIGLKTAANCAR